MTQQQINRAQRRSLKTKYGHLNPQEKRLIKLREEERMLERNIKEQWRDIYNKQKPPYLEETTPDDVLDMIDLAESWRDRLARVRRSKERLIKKYGLDEDKIAHIHMLSNLAPGGSF